MSAGNPAQPCIRFFPLPSGRGEIYDEKEARVKSIRKKIAELTYLNARTIQKIEDGQTIS
jgi:hypothetical protein